MGRPQRKKQAEVINHQNKQKDRIAKERFLAKNIFFLFLQNNIDTQQLKSLFSSWMLL
jgi:hypothetical protein